MLERRISSSQEHLSQVVSLAEEWDSEMETPTPVAGDERYDTPTWVCDAMELDQGADQSDELQELRPLLAVDKTELEQDIARLRRQIALLQR